MKEVEKVAKKPTAKPAEPVPEPDLSVLLKRNVSLIEKAVNAKEPRFMGRVLRQTGVFRKKLTSPKIEAFVKSTLPEGAVMKPILLDSLSSEVSGMQVDAPSSGKETTCLPETEIYACLVVILYLIDQKLYEKAKVVTTAAVQRLDTFNRRSLDLLAARVYFYLSWSHECLNTLDEIRSKLLALHRTATLHHDNIGQEMLLNLLLRNYLHYNLYDLAEKLRSKTELPESRSNQQYCRYLHYLGRIRAIQLEYTDAKECLIQASRKAPQAALGFRIVVHKWLALVRLLLGEIPERTMFRQKGLEMALEPYFCITQAVRIGDLNAFRAAVDKYQTVFQTDKTMNLITRLRKNVIRTGLRRINLAYSCISMTDIATKLGLGLTDDVESIVAKAIRDGAIDATLDHPNRCMYSKDQVDVYSSQEPQGAFHARISFCLDTYNEAVTAMRFPPDAHKKGLESAEARKERQQQEQELAQHIAEEEEEEEDF